MNLFYVEYKFKINQLYCDNTLDQDDEITLKSDNACQNCIQIEQKLDILGQKHVNSLICLLWLETMTVLTLHLQVAVLRPLVCRAVPRPGSLRGRGVMTHVVYNVIEHWGIQVWFNDGDKRFLLMVTLLLSSIILDMNLQSSGEYEMWYDELIHPSSTEHSVTVCVSITTLNSVKFIEQRRLGSAIYKMQNIRLIRAKFNLQHLIISSRFLAVFLKECEQDFRTFVSI